MPHRHPSYRLHKPSGRAVVTLDGRDYYLGKHGSPESRAEYDRLVAEWLAAGRSVPVPITPGPTVVEVLAAFWTDAERRRRRPDGKPALELENIRDALRPLRRLYGHTLAAQFGPVALRVVRDEMIRSGLARTTVNARINRIRRVFKWAVGHELVPASVYQTLQAVEGLRAGQCEAPEPPGVGPVPVEHVEAALPHMPRPVAALVRLMLLTGMRLGEAVIMRGRDLDLGAGEYRPHRHKGTWRGHTRVIALGPRAVEVIRPFLTTDPDRYLFSPRDTVEALRRERKGGRAPQTVAAHYDRRSYRQAILRACDKARVPRWSPLQLRHRVATDVRAQYGLEHAADVLGHAKPDVTTRYAERSLERAKSVVRVVG